MRERFDGEARAYAVDLRLNVMDKKAIAVSQKEGMPCPFYNSGKMEGVYFRNTFVVEKNDLSTWGRNKLSIMY